MSLAGPCPYCGGPMPPPKGTGRPAKYCRPRCRNSAERDRRAEERRLAEALAAETLRLQQLAERHAAVTELVRCVTADPMRAITVLIGDDRHWPTSHLEELTRALGTVKGAPPRLRRDPVWWEACAWCPRGGRMIGERQRAVAIVYGKALRRVHSTCLPYALAAGASVAPRGAGVVSSGPGQLAGGRTKPL